MKKRLDINDYHDYNYINRQGKEKMQMEIYKDEKRTISIGDHGALEINGRKNITIHMYTTQINDTVPGKLAATLRKMGEDPADWYTLSMGKIPVAFPRATKAVVEKAIADYKAAVDAERNRPEKIERRKIDAMYAEANRIANSGRDDNVSTPIMLRMDADELLRKWRAKYEGAAKTEEKDNLIHKADHERSLAIGALTYDADGSINEDARQARHDEHIEKAQELESRAQNL
jgi:hypothetical protein